MSGAPKWTFEAEYVQSCNCDYGCPCNFNGYPTYGNCEALVGYRIRQGNFGNVKLNGVKFAVAAYWPQAIHEGNGTARYYIDAPTTEQFNALAEILSGKYGGGFIEVFPRTWTKVYPPKATQIDFHFDGPTSWFKVDGIGEVHSEHIRNPVTGEMFEGTIHLPKGFSWKEGHPTNIKHWHVHDEDILARHENKSGFFGTVKLANEGCIG